MDKEEAEKIINILLKCDGGCEYCVLKLFCKEFPEYAELTQNIFLEILAENLKILN